MILHSDPTFLYIIIALCPTRVSSNFENIFKEGCREPVTDNKLNNFGEKVDTQIPESQEISSTPGNLPKQPGEKNGEKNVSNRDSYTPQEKVKSPG